MKRTINVLHFVIMSGLYLSAYVLYIIYFGRLFLTLFGVGHIFTWQDWTIFLLTQAIVINCFFIIRYKGVMDLFGFPFDDKSLLP